MTRTRLALAPGTWRCLPDPAGEGEALGFHRPGFDDASWARCRLPASFDDCFAEMEGYEGAAWFRCRFRVPGAWRGSRVVLRFEGVNPHARVWVNGRRIGRNDSAFLPFEFAVQGAIRMGGENMLAVCVDAGVQKEDIPGRRIGWRPFAGILREVTLERSNVCSLRRIRIVPEWKGGAGVVSLACGVGNDGSARRGVRVRAQLLSPSGGGIAELVSGGVDVGPGSARVLSLRARLGAVDPWVPAAPRLYRARIRLEAGGRILDQRELRFGFRRIEVRKGRLLLNGQPLILRGFNRHEDCPRTGMAVDRQQVRRDLLAMRGAGANFIRLAHYPHHPAELELCDELGLLAMGEVPLYWWSARIVSKAAAWRQEREARRQLERMVERDHAHPSVIFWSVSNETSEEERAVRQGNQCLVAHVRRLDPTRLVGHVSDRWPQHPCFERDDVIFVNAYPTLSPDRYDWPRRPARPGDAGTAIRRTLDRLHRRYPAKPILMTEFGYPYVPGSRHGRFSEAFAARAVAREFRGMQAPYMCGTVYWCYAVHPWPFGQRFFHGALESPYGAVSRARRPSAVWRMVSRLFQGRA